MKRTLIAISSCQYFENAGLNQCLRDTWLPDAVALDMDYKFFHGIGAAERDDVVVVPVDDGLGGLAEKAKAKARWALDQGYDFMFSCFPDTYVCPERLALCGYEKFDYFGNVYQHPGGGPFCQGGPGYMLSRKACEFIADCPHSYLNDDCFIGDVLNREDILRGDCREFAYVGPGPLRTNGTITNHLSTQPGGYTAEGLHAEHRRWKDS